MKLRIVHIPKIQPAYSIQLIGAKIRRGYQFYLDDNPSVIFEVLARLGNWLLVRKYIVSEWKCDNFGGWINDIPVNEIKDNIFTIQETPSCRSQASTISVLLPPLVKRLIARLGKSSVYRKAGFTTIELLIVIALLVILVVAVITIPL